MNTLKRRAFVFGLTLTCALLVSSLAVAQAAGPLVRLTQVSVKPGQTIAYESAVKELFTEMGNSGQTRAIAASVSDRGLYGYLMIFTDFADVQAFETASEANQSAAGAASRKRVDDASEFSSSFFLQVRPDLSYTPANPRIKESEVGFTRLTLLYLERGSETRADELMGKFLALAKSKNLPNAYTAGYAVTGEELPLLYVAVGAKDAADSYAQQAKIQEMLGEEFGALQAQFGPILRRIENVNITARPDLSFSPGS